MVGYALKRAQLAVFEEAIQGFAKLDLRPAHYSILALVAFAPGRKQSDVAAALGIQRANFVALIDGLERRGLAERRPVPNDRRSHALHLTREGKRVLARANALVARVTRASTPSSVRAAARGCWTCSGASSPTAEPTRCTPSSNEPTPAKDLPDYP
jgi:DNA-binding MarR family transcriptional regulator